MSASRDILLLNSVEAPSQPTPSYLLVRDSTKQKPVPGSWTSVGYLVSGTELFLSWYPLHLCLPLQKWIGY